MSSEICYLYSEPLLIKVKNCDCCLCDTLGPLGNI